MRLRCWWRQMTFSAAMLMTGTVGTAAAQEPGVAPVPADTSVVATEPTAEAADVRAMIDRLDREVQSLRTQLEEERRTKAQTASLADSLQDKKADAKAAAVPGMGACKEVPIITKPTITVFGRILFDQIMYEDPPALVAATGVDRFNETGFSTIRIGAKGNVYENVLYQVEVEFEGSETDYKDCFFEFTNAPLLGTVRLGHFKEPFSLEELTSNRFHTFMQRSSAHGALVPSRNFGIMAYNYIAENDNWSWFAGTFRADSPDNPVGRASHIDDLGDWVFTGRLAGLLFYDEPSQGRYLAHVGGAYSYRNTATLIGGAQSVSFASRPELGSQNGYLLTSFPGDDDWNLFGAEAAVVWGPASLQAEYYLAQPDGADLSGGYVQASYFITGENRGYKKDTKAFERVKPTEDFFRVSTADGVCMGRGAWELKARYSWIDLNAGVDSTAGVSRVPGYQNNVAVGANWYWNPYTRMMFDYVMEEVDLVPGGLQESTNMLGMRFQIDY